MSTNEGQAKRRGMNTRDALVFLVDWRVSMIQKDPEISIGTDLCRTPGNSSLLSITLRCIADVMKTKIISRTNDAISVIAFGTRGSKETNRWPAVRVIRPLLPANASGIKQLQRLARRLEAGDADELAAMTDVDLINTQPVPEDDPDFCFGADTEVLFDKALWAVRHQFTSLAASTKDVLVRKKVFIFTNDEDPPREKDPVYKLCATQAKDLADLGASLDVSILKSPSQLTESQQEDGALEVSKFFSDLVYTDEETLNETRGNVMVTTVYSFEDLCDRVRKKEMTKRALRKTVLVLGNDYKIGVGLYSLVKKAVRPAKVELVAATNKPVFKVTTHTCEAYGEILKPPGMRHMPQPEYLKTTRRMKDSERVKIRLEKGIEELDEKQDQLIFGFTKTELVKAKALGKVGLYLYGFRNRDILRKEENLCPAAFVFPDETEYVGSMKSFTILLKCMINRDLIGIVSVRLTDTQGTGMRFAALVPQQEKTADDGVEQLVPGGFHLIYLPFKDDIYTDWRKFFNEDEKEEKEELKEELKEEETHSEKIRVKQEDVARGELSIEPSSVSTARRLVRKLKVEEYDPEAFLNPDLQRFYAGLEHAAGVETSFNPKDDLLNPKTEKMQNRVGYLATELKRLTVGTDYDADGVAKRFKTLSNKRAAEMSEKALRKEQEKQAVIAQLAQKCNDDDYITAYQNGALNKMLRTELQLYCKVHGLRASGTKANLIILIEEHIAKRLK